MAKITRGLSALIVLSYNKSIKFLFISILLNQNIYAIHHFSDTFFMKKKYLNLSASGGNSRKLKGDSLGRAETTDVSSFMLCPGFAVTQSRPRRTRFHPTPTYRCKLPPSSVLTIFLMRLLSSFK